MNRNEKIRTYNYSRNAVTDHRISGLSQQVPGLVQFFSGQSQDSFHLLEQMRETLERKAKRDRLIAVLSTSS